jgi:hypothetical protein
MLEDLTTITYAYSLIPLILPSKTSLTRPLNIYQIHNIGRSNVASSAIYTLKVYINVNSYNSIITTLDNRAKVNVISWTITKESKLVIENRDYLFF